ncbi:hypothetical protein OEZ86_008555 [Tetradesmus obliquus]|nr:hypothetical protein OEZ86_008555 [Tetradesmus obliquus]
MRRNYRYHLAGISSSELERQVLAACYAVGVAGAASGLILQHVANRRVSAHPQSLPLFLAAYKRLEAQYGAHVAQEWLRRAPPIIRSADEVPSRLQQLSQLMGGADQQAVLALTRRCPMVLGVEAGLMAPRLEGLCKLLQRPVESEGSLILQAAPALLAMDPGTLAVKVQRLELLAQKHPKWAEAYARCPSKGRAVLLTYSLKRQMRLVFLAQQGLQEKQDRHGGTCCLSMSTIMAWSEEKMQQLHPQRNSQCMAQVQQ